jgi:PAS domain S-box-containing protein
MDIFNASSHDPNLLKQILSSIRHAIIITDVNGDILYTNPVVLDIFGSDSKYLKGKNISSFFTPEDIDCLYPNLLSMAKDNKPFEGELMLMRENGDRFFVYIVLNPIPDSFDNKKLIIISIQDIDEKKALQKSIQTTRHDDLVKVAEGIAHELRNPLVGIGGFVNRLYKSRKGNAEDDKYYGYIIKNLDKIEGLVRKIQFFVGLPDPSFARHEMDNLVNKALDDHIEQIKKKNIKLSIKIEKIVLVLDGELISRVISILLQNSMDALSEGGNLDIIGETGEDSYRLRVSDSGHGIPPENLPYIFNPFFTTKAHGAGIDLAVAKRIMVSHGGTIDAKSDQGKNSTIILTFPLERRRAIRSKRFGDLQLPEEKQ